MLFSSLRRKTARPVEPEMLFDDPALGLEPETVRQAPIPKWGRNMALPIVVFACVLGLVALHQKSEHQRAQTVRVDGLLSVQKAKAHRINDAAAAALAGNAGALRELERRRAELQTGFEALQVAAAEQGPGAFPVAALAALEARWQALQSELKAALERSATVVAVRNLAGTAGAELESAEVQAFELFAVLPGAGGSAQDITIAGRLAARLARMSADAALLGEGSDPLGQRSRRLAVELDAFVSDLGRIAGVSKRVGQSDGAADAVANLATRLETRAPVFAGRTRELLAVAPALAAARETARASRVAINGLIGSLDGLNSAYRDTAAAHVDYPFLFDALSALTLILVVMFALQIVGELRRHIREARAWEEEVRERNRHNQDAILRLLDEISALADGDLRTHTTVTEEITGAVADAVNYAIDALRELVSRINKTSVAVAGSAQTTRRRTSRLSKAADTQTNQIARATVSIRAMATAGLEVSESANVSRSVAQHSVEVATRGAVAVRETIAGMAEIRETIADSAKRLKRLGESSQEIGNIVGLIDDIADQTNVLALNAAIQASMAGEAGRGFGVVADEVQRLAERARQATKRIEGLVNTIQLDTNEAIRSMEHSTIGVVAGARLAEDAGDSLAEIESVSQRLAEHIDSISDRSTKQSTRAAALADAMQAIQSFAVQVRSGTNVTAKSASRLGELAQALESSVARFSLPSTSQENVVDLIPGASAESRASAEANRDRTRSKV